MPAEPIQFGRLPGLISETEAPKLWLRAVSRPVRFRKSDSPIDTARPFFK
jgi:hypothetical protein